jgi:hypothetical protein
VRRDITLAGGEVVRWEGRPAPRCYTFRNWPHALFGIVLLVLAVCWQILGIDMAGTYDRPWVGWLPLPFVLLGGYLAAGHFVKARLEWNRVLYLITDRRLIVQRGLLSSTIASMDLAAVTYFSLHRQGTQLGTLRIHQGQQRKLVLHCLEYPQRPAELLEQAIRKGERTPDRPG